MKERPILFSGDMVRAILDGRKTQTRRPVKFAWSGSADELMHQSRFDPAYRCPLGQPGDRLWVRETWTKTQYEKPVYRADSRDRDGCVWPSVASDPNGVLWKPSIHMPRWASRITLEVTRVWVERVQDITEEGANAEGCVDGGCLACGKREPCRCATSRFSRRDSFAELWQSIYGTWAANPWVWAVEFRRVQP